MCVCAYTYITYTIYIYIKYGEAECIYVHHALAGAQRGQKSPGPLELELRGL